MTDEEILSLPEVRGFMDNFAKWCGAPRSVFEGQFLVAARAAQDATRERCAQEAERSFIGHYAAEAIARRIRALWK